MSALYSDPSLLLVYFLNLLLKYAFKKKILKYIYLQIFTKILSVQLDEFSQS